MKMGYIFKIFYVDTEKVSLNFSVQICQIAFVNDKNGTKNFLTDFNIHSLYLAWH